MRSCIFHGTYPIDCSPPMNSWRVNSHIVAAFMCHDMTSC
uniref:Uncharacterized protein n=1 Tax=Arundo donax TaxID=35708 RepID=A0A0A9EXG2_ARUDO